ncbi:MAG: MATE family efflux transporter [Bacteroidales bacterium]|nr:MATE family efflux transporter [Bacteroidales bacterium]
MKPLDREILRLALPSILANITVPLVGMVDLAVAGHLGSLGEAATLIGGVSVGTMLFDLLYWNFGFLRVGTGGLTAQAYGREDWQGTRDILFRGVVLALLIAALILALQWPFVHLALYVTHGSEAVRELALRYFFIRIWAAPATLSLMSIKGWFIGMQDTVSSMATDLVVNVVNIVASVILGRWIGFAGIAWGTVIAQFTGLAFAGVLIARLMPPGKGGIRQAVSGADLGAFLTMNGNLFIRSLCMVAIYVGFTMISARYGDLILAIGAILMKLLLLFSFFTDGFAYAAEALGGKFIGRRDLPAVKMTVRHVFVWSMGIGMFFVLFYLFGSYPAFRVMTSDPLVADAARPFYFWLLLMPPIGCAAFTWDGIFVGATASRALRNSLLWALLSFFGLWYFGYAVRGFSLLPEDALHLLLAAYFAHLLVRTLYLSYRYKKTRSLIAE